MKYLYGSAHSLLFIMKSICPVCGYDQLSNPPLAKLVNGKLIYSYLEGAHQFDICPCCGIEFGNEDFEKTWEELRVEWIESGFSWHYGTKPNNWNPKKQLNNLKKIYH